MTSQFGEHLKDWRNRRRMSQLDLGLFANVSARHIAFLETGRSKPSRSMVIQLSEALEIPRNDRNTLLNSAGFAPAYKRRELDDEEMVFVREATEWMLERHAPYPAFAYDRHWHLVIANKPAEVFLCGLELQIGDCMLDMFLTSQKVRDVVENWPQVARHLAMRLRTESAHVGGDAFLDKGAEQLFQEAGDLGEDIDGPLDVLFPSRYRMGDVVLSLASTISQFGSAEDIALADMRIELLFPADEVTKVFLQQMGQATS